MTLDQIILQLTELRKTVPGDTEVVRPNTRDWPMYSEIKKIDRENCTKFPEGFQPISYSGLIQNHWPKTHVIYFE